MPQKLPWPDAAHWTYRVTLYGYNVRLSGDYVDDQGWFISIFDEDDVAIAVQRRCVSRWNLFLTIVDPRCYGGLIVWSDQDVPDRQAFNEGRATLYCMTTAELEAAGADLPDDVELL